MSSILVKPKILGDLSDIVAPRNSSVKAKCESVGVPSPTIVWQKLSGKIELYLWMAKFNLVNCLQILIFLIQTSQVRSKRSSNQTF